MSKRQYLNALKLLGLTPFGNDTEKALGLRKRQLGRLAAGEQLAPPMLVCLLEALIKLKT